MLTDALERRTYAKIKCLFFNRNQASPIWRRISATALKSLRDIRMGEAKRKRLLGFGPTHISPAVDMDVAIEDLERHVEAGQVKGFVQIAKLENVAPGVSPIKLWTFGLEKSEVYDMLREMKKAMEQTMGFKDD